MSHRTNRKAIARLEAVYARLPRVACRGLCAVACGPVPMTELEADRCRRADAGRRLPMIREDASCIYLNGQRCSVYDVRPLICRVWGVVQRMSCIHGCVPERWLTDKEFLVVAQAVERVGGSMVLPTTTTALAPHDSFFDFPPESTWMPDAMIDDLATKTRGLRALHGGRIIGAFPSRPGEARVVDIDEE